MVIFEQCTLMTKAFFVYTFGLFVKFITILLIVISVRHCKNVEYAWWMKNRKFLLIVDA